MTLRVLLHRRMLYCCATPAARKVAGDEPQRNDLHGQTFDIPRGCLLKFYLRSVVSCLAKLVTVLKRSNKQSSLLLMAILDDEVLKYTP